MAEDDIYGNKSVYENFKANLDCLTLRPEERKLRRKSKNAVKYYCKNESNLKYFRKLITIIEAKDLSFIRRIRLLQTLVLISHSTEKNLKECTRDDVNGILADMHNNMKSPVSKATFIKNLKYIWKQILPELDEKGRPDETIIPYVVRHLSAKIDKSRQKLRKDKLTLEEFEKIVDYFSNDPRLQAYITFSFESLARPQEILYRKIGNLELHDNYAKIWLTDHGKEGVGMLQCIDSFPYLLKWLEVHPFRNDKNAYLFINTGNANRGKKLRPENINKFLRIACKDLGIDKPVTCYSLKRNGVTIRRLRGDSDVEIQHVARWTSTDRLKTYDLSSQDDAFDLALKKKGLIKEESGKTGHMDAKKCGFCDAMIGFNETICPKCKHLVDRNSIIKEQQKDAEIDSLKKQLNDMQSQITDIQEQTMRTLMEKIIRMQESPESLKSL